MATPKVSKHPPENPRILRKHLKTPSILENLPQAMESMKPGKTPKRLGLPYPSPTNSSCPPSASAASLKGKAFEKKTPGIGPKPPSIRKWTKLVGLFCRFFSKRHRYKPCLSWFVKLKRFLHGCWLLGVFPVQIWRLFKASKLSLVRATFRVPQILERRRITKFYIQNLLTESLRDTFFNIIFERLLKCDLTCTGSLNAFMCHHSNAIGSLHKVILHPCPMV